MPYIERQAVAGNVIEKRKCHSRKYPAPKGKKLPRAAKANVTPEDQKKINSRIAEEKLRLLILANFHEDDHYITLTYGGDEPTPEEAKKIIKNFLKRLSYYYQKRGVIFKYIIITEYKKTRIHHHMILNNACDLGVAEIRQIWGQGWIKKEAYQGRAQDAERIARYFIKEEHSAFYTDERVFGRRWSPSRNLTQPVIESRVISAASWRKTPSVPKGYYLEKSSYREGVTADGYPYQFYRLIRLEADDIAGHSKPRHGGDARRGRRHDLRKT